MRVAAARGKEWEEKVRIGKANAKINPSLLYKARVAKGLTQSDMAIKLGMSMTSYCAVERGKRMVKELIGMLIATLVTKELKCIFKVCVEEKQKYIARMSKPNLEEKRTYARPTRKSTRARVSSKSKSDGKKHSVQRRAK